MILDLLRSLAVGELPMAFEDARKIQLLRRCADAGHIELEDCPGDAANLSSPHRVLVRSVSSEGHAALALIDGLDRPHATWMPTDWGTSNLLPLK